MKTKIIIAVAICVALALAVPAIRNVSAAGKTDQSQSATAFPTAKFRQLVLDLVDPKSDIVDLAAYRSKQESILKELTALVQLATAADQDELLAAANRVLGEVMPYPDSYNGRFNTVACQKVLELADQLKPAEKRQRYDQVMATAISDDFKRQVSKKIYLGLR